MCGFWFGNCRNGCFDPRGGRGCNRGQGCGGNNWSLICGSNSGWDRGNNWGFMCGYSSGWNRGSNSGCGRSKGGCDSDCGC